MRSITSFLLLALLASASPAQEEPRERTFIVELAKPGLVLEVNGNEAVTDAQGTLRVTIRVAAGETLRFRSRDPAWSLNALLVVPSEDPSVPVLWDLSSELRPVAPPTESPVPAEAESPEAESPEASEAPVVEDPCRGRKSLRCRQARWSRFQRALERQDCRAAIGALRDLENEYPELLTAAGSVAAFAQAYLDCGLAAADDVMVRRAVDLLAGQGDEMWCGVTESRILARGYEALDEIATAAESAAAAQPLCRGADPEAASPALEWEFYFRYRLGAFERASEIAEAAPRRPRLFLSAWLRAARGECAADQVELDPSGDLPCRGLPQSFCSRQYGRILLACGTDSADFEAAVTYLSAALPVDPAAWDALVAEDGGQLIAELAEAEVLAGDYPAAIRLYERLLESLPKGEAGAERRATVYRLYGDALLASDAEEATVRAALSAYDRARGEIVSDPVALAVVTNNVCVLRGRLGDGTDDDRIESDLGELEAVLEEFPPEEDRLRLWLKRNLFSLRIRLLEEETDLDVQERLVRLQELRGPMTEYQRELESLAEDALRLPVEGTSFERIRQGGRRFAVALP